MKNFVQPGDTITLTASRTVASGEGMLRGGTFGVATSAVANGAVGQFQITGVVTLPKAAGTFAEGALLYWDNAAFNVTTTVGSNVKIGVVANVGGTSGATVLVRLNGAF